MRCLFRATLIRDSTLRESNVVLCTYEYWIVRKVTHFYVG